MAYCDKCGAYIPDGQSKCLACGYDEAAETAAAQAAAQATAQQAENGGSGHFKNYDEIYRAQMEEHRRRQQEQNRKWAEEEQRRRAAAQQTRASDSASYDAAESGSSASSYAPDREKSKVWGVLSYISVLCLIPLLTGRGGENAKFHAKQGVRLVVFGALADLMSSIPGIGWLFSVARFILMLIGMSNAANGRRQPLPYIGSIGSF